MNAPLAAPHGRPAFDRTAARRLAAILLLVVAIPLAWIGKPDAAAAEQVEAGLKRALVTFALARAANGVLSVLQETTLGASFVVGVTVSPGQILDPLNDLVEQFSSVMLVAAMSLGGQRILIAVGSWWPIALALTLALLAWGALVWRLGRAPRALTRLVLLLLLVRFAVPVSALATEAVYRGFMASEVQTAQRELDVVSSSLNLSPRSLDWSSAGERLKAKAEEMVAHVVRLMTIFFLQTLLLPLVFVVLLQRALATIMQASGPRPD